MLEETKILIITPYHGPIKKAAITITISLGSYCKNGACGTKENRLAFVSGNSTCDSYAGISVFGSSIVDVAIID